MIFKAIYDILSKETDITTLVSNRIYPLRVAQGEPMPSIVYQLTGKTPANSKCNVSALDLCSFQITVIAEKYETTDLLSSYLRVALDKYRGDLKNSNIDKINMVNETDDYDDDAQLFIKRIDYDLRLKP